MKLKATKKSIRDNSYRILSIGYCDAQRLLSNESAFAYSAGLYGWDCDYYDVDGVTVSTGYRPLNSYKMKDDYKLVGEYENKAKDLNHEQRSVLLRELVAQLKQD